MSKEMLGPDCAVRILGPTILRYREGGKTAFVDGEMRNGAEDFAIYESSLSTWVGSTERLAKEERDRIVENIRRTLALHGFQLSVE